MPNTTVYARVKGSGDYPGQEPLDRTRRAGIRVNSISPGPIESALLSPKLSTEELQQTKDWIVSQVPMKRFGQPEDIAAAVLYLTSPESSFVIGADLIIDGGMETLS
jgi:NAD(P)-dependent dehydrogenase (short-subunit alcohol dehydrogenase family)